MESGRRRERFPWLAIWRTGDELPYNAFEAGLPRFNRHKNDLLNCTMDHVDRCEDSLAVNRHKMRCIVTKCASQRCKDAEGSCRARYKILKYMEVDYVVIYEQGEHCMAIDAPPSPVSSPELTTEMKDYIVSKLEDAPSMVPLLAYSFMSRELTSGRIAGQAPALEKVQNSVKTWRGKNKPDRMEPVLEICRQSMYDGGAAERTSESLLVFCDTQVVDGAVQPALGTGSAANPFRIGLTCMALLESYVKVQRDPTLSTLLHLDSTHSIVKQKYPVFVMGISDRSGSFMPVVYYCTSLRKAQDIRWCLAFLKRVILHEFGLIFSPDFVMMDADKAQFKACEQEIQSTKILMCWFHVTQNVHKHVDGAKLSMITRKKIFRDLYGLHFAETEDDYLRKREFVVRSWRGAGALCLRVKRVMDHLLKLWILGARFAQWQAFHTPTGYATTNNPLETYHYTLKLVNDNKRATPSELVSGLDLSRLGYISSMSGFDNVPTVSKRLKAVFNRAEKLKELEAEVVHLHSLIVVRVWPKLTSTASVDEEETEDAPSANTIKNSYRSSNYRRLMWEGMPEGGWVVDPVGRSCKCPCWRKAGMCLHVIKATKVAHMHCPGMPPPALRFVSAARTNRGRSTHRQQQSSLSVGAVQLEPVEPVWLKAAALFRP